MRACMGTLVGWEQGEALEGSLVRLVWEVVRKL